MSNSGFTKIVSMAQHLGELSVGEVSAQVVDTAYERTLIGYSPIETRTAAVAAGLMNMSLGKTSGAEPCILPIGALVDSVSLIALPRTSPAVAVAGNVDVGHTPVAAPVADSSLLAAVLPASSAVGAHRLFVGAVGAAGTVGIAALNQLVMTTAAAEPNHDFKVVVKYRLA
jgi:hypothetical protein